MDNTEVNEYEMKIAMPKFGQLLYPFLFGSHPSGIRVGRAFPQHNPSMHPASVYGGRSKTFKANVRKVKKRQRRRAYYKSLRG